MNLAGKNILVVGGSSGIGLALVHTLIKNGAKVYVISRSRPGDFPSQAEHLSLDITGNLDSVQLFLPEILDGLVYAVGSINLKPFGRLTADDFLNDYRLNVLGAAQIIQQSAKQLKSSAGSSIVLISTVAVKIGLAYHASVSAAKGAVEGLALALAAEFAAQQIRVNVVAPSLTDTPLAQNLLNSPEKREASAKRHPLSRIGQPQDISNLIAFLLSEESSWITGQVIGIDGGLGKLKTN
ncbi:SDR family NAD(P)-dependent oxidoreductase [Daejeonella sp.]|uniref:SDR family NAD(P)-dependent oxidoreductase n=1 Tax=Daejeonella sp. TaxID=2805397 RepID=UPI0039832C13